MEARDAGRGARIEGGVCRASRGWACRPGQAAPVLDFGFRIEGLSFDVSSSGFSDPG